MYEELVIVFFKTPALGQVKTRLAASVGEAKALRYYQAMLMDLKKNVQIWESEGRGRKVLFFGNVRSEDWQKLGLVKSSLQLDGDLGVKMQKAMREALTMAQKVLIIGTDSPELGKNDFDRCFKALDQFDAVLGPCEDGGYYMMGVKHMPPTLLWDLPWSSEKTLERVIQRLEGHHFKINLLELKSDIDTLEDLKKMNYRLDMLEELC